ncbi:MAG: class I SAM-dependent methyltransferase [Bacteroidetes bacterium]|nr:MAG: class I SAM-dependent methyltransferase [Bacteroidota bacterium]
MLDSLASPTANSRITYAACPACESGDITYLLTAKDHTVSQETFDIWQCEACQLRFTQNVPRETDIGRYYQSEDYISHSDTQKGLINWLYHRVRSITLRQKRKWVEKYAGRKSGRLLDIGCGTGAFLNTMQKAGWQTLGLEPDEGARAYARQQYGLDVRKLEAMYELPAGQFDVISLWHVLEHVHQLHPCLQRIHELLAPGGTLFVAVPNYLSADAAHYRQHWAAYDVPRHLYHFCPTAMRLLLQKYQLEIKKQIGMPFDGFYVSLLSERYQHGHTRLIQGFWSGLKSFLSMKQHSGKASAILYVIQKSS